LPDRFVLTRPVEGWRVTLWFRLARIVAPLTILLALAGCGDAFNAGPMRYVESDRLASELSDKPELQKAVRKALADLFGADPQTMNVPPGAGLPGGGYRLGSKLVDPADRKVKAIFWIPEGGDPKKDALPQAGGYGLYRLHCLHCHGVSGAGDGPTAPFLYPRPRDYRPGKFKFTSTTTDKPTREDLHRTIANGLHGTSMPAFDALMTAREIEQVVDYVTFLSMRGETELSLIDEAAASADLPPDVAADVAKSVFNKWKQAGSLVLNPPMPRVPSTRESVHRGRELFLGRNTTGQKVVCTSCHGAQAVGDGPSIVSQDVFNEVVFGGNPSEQDHRLEEVFKRVEKDATTRTGSKDAGKAEANQLRETWKSSLDDWGMPLRPANLNRGVYKGGRRPIDIYWRIAKGINGAKMPAHASVIGPEQIWDLVNFVLALPDDKTLLEGAKLPDAIPAGAAKPSVANR
jgi:mono/diheme cytochrome c family protein